MANAQNIIQAMLKNDAYSQWMGIEVKEISEDEVVIKMEVREEMCNGFGILHGGVTYAFADSAFAFLSNSQGKHAFSIESSISHLSKVQVKDELWARAQKIKIGNRISTFLVDITNQDDELVAHFKGVAYNSSTKWEL